MDIDNTRASLVCFRYHQSGHLACDCPQAFNIQTMTPEERLGLLPELLALTNSEETLGLPTDPEGLIRDSAGEALEPKELTEEHFGNRSG